MHHRKRSLTAAAAVLAASAVQASTVTHAQEPTKGDAMRGAWGFSARGTIVLPDSPPIPAVAVGVMTFEPNGGCTIEDTINIGGASESRTSVSCSYSLERGRGTITATFAGSGDVPLSFVLVDHEREMRFIRTDLGVAEGVGRPQ
jgi:hypothetical protein